MLDRAPTRPISAAGLALGADGYITKPYTKTCSPT